MSKLYTIFFLFGLQSITEFAFNLPFCLSPMFIVGTFKVGASNKPLDEFPKIQADNNVVILPTIIFYDEGEEVKRLQGDMSFTLKVTTDELDEIIEEILGSKF